MKQLTTIMMALVLSVSFIHSAAYAEDNEAFAVKPNRGLNAVQHRQLDTLFDSLRHAKSEVEALSHEREIWRIWIAPEDKTLRKLMDAAIDKVRNAEYEVSVEMFDDIIERYPKYAEVWNQRALAHFQLRNFEASLKDIATTLKLEPRHFGALSGRGVIHLEQGETKLAKQAILRAMRYHPYISSRRLLQDIPLIEANDGPFI
ncbi:tetratricopeptide repeat protein [Leucothrix pacifica]|uniref:Uncharacterized protein n=1 Tax=Leucothrix pacifica TaxID=1247513 RepID=A0A317CE04_9GAMM|nr:tetratricopeptide repeat protein [Leucothrix pacifica]PWQ96884.1 hypothetical protein DKW60_11800 [Leucothrix pacifica]